jgi:hypothetical protein
MSPVALFNVKPGGKAPLVSVHKSGATPPVVVMGSEKGTPNCSAAGHVAVMVSEEMTIEQVYVTLCGVNDSLAVSVTLMEMG